MINLSIRFQNFVGIGAGWNQARTVGNGCGPDIQRIWIIGSIRVMYRNFYGAVCWSDRRQLLFSDGLKILQHVVFHEIYLLCQQYAQERWIHTVTDKETENKNTRFRKKLGIWYFYACGLV